MNHEKNSDSKNSFSLDDRTIYRDPPAQRPPTPEELEASKVDTREWYIQAAIHLKAKAEAEAKELEAKKPTLTPEELKVEEAQVTAELARAEKEYQTMLEEARPTAEEVRAAELKMAVE